MEDDIDVKKVAIETIVILDYIDDDVLPEDGSQSYDHLYLILNDVRTGLVTGTKAHRYIGWAQCAISIYTRTNLALFRDLNRKHQTNKEKS